MSKSYRKVSIKAITPFLLVLACKCALAGPLIIAHRAGFADAPENSVLAIETALKNGADAIWLSIQLSKDGEPVAYRPDDLAELTTGRGLVSQYSATQLSGLTHKNGRDGSSSGSQGEPRRATQLAGKLALGIPSLSHILQIFPNTEFYLDLKSPDADPLRFAKAIDRVLGKHKSYQRTIVYSTNRAYSDAFKGFAQVRRMVAREVTREILLANLLSNNCIAADRERGLHGFELKREICVEEKFKLGIGRTQAVMKVDKRGTECLLSVPENELMLFGINSLEEYQQAVSYRASAVMVDSPALFKGQIQQVKIQPRPTAVGSQ